MAGAIATPGSRRAPRNIKYWEEVLHWVKACQGLDVPLLDRQGPRQ